MAQTKEEKLAQLFPEQREKYDALAEKIEKVKKAHPEFNEKALGALDAALEHELYSQLELKNKIDTVEKSSGIKTPKQAMEIKGRLQKRLSDEWMEKRKKFGVDGLRALSFLEEEKRGGVTSVTRNFYDKNDGGMQWSGILGGIAGLIGGMMLGGGMGTWIGIIMMIAGVLVGSWLGNKTGDAISGIGKSSSSVKTAQGPAIEKDGPEQERMEAAQRTADRNNTIESASKNAAKEFLNSADVSLVSQDGNKVVLNLSGNLDTLKTKPDATTPQIPMTLEGTVQGNNFLLNRMTGTVERDGKPTTVDVPLPVFEIPNAVGADGKIDLGTVNTVLDKAFHETPTGNTIRRVINEIRPKGITGGENVPVENSGQLQGQNPGAKAQEGQQIGGGRE